MEKQLLNYIKQKKQVNVSELVDKFQKHRATIYRYLIKLQQK
jgi:DeoR/GlpR family transcriptional regulator of sugar metabolism